MKRMLAKVVIGSLLGVAAAGVAAADLNQLQSLGTQSAFHSLTQDLGAALSYKSLSPATPLGITGFDVGVDASFTHMNSKAFATASNSSISTLPLVRLRAQKGLPLNFDVGLSYTKIPSSNISLWGGELRYAILPGGVATPAVAVRGTYSKLSGVDQLGFDTKGIDVSISKGFVGFTPYGGIGRVWANATPRNVPVLVLSSESVGLNRIFAGVNWGMGIFALGGEYDRTGSSNTYSVKVSLRW